MFAGALLLAAASFQAQAQTTNPATSGRDKRNTQSTTVKQESPRSSNPSQFGPGAATTPNSATLGSLPDTAMNASATNDGASGQSGSPLATEAMENSHGSSTNQGTNTGKQKRTTGNQPNGASSKTTTPPKR